MKDVLFVLYGLVLVVIIIAMVVFLSTQAAECAAQGGNYVREWTGWYVCVGGPGE